MNTSLLSLLQWDLALAFIVALLAGLFIRTSLNKSKEDPIQSLVTLLVTIAIMVTLPYIIQAELLDKAIKVIGSLMAVPIIGIMVGRVLLVRFFGTYHGAFGIFAFALPMGWLLGQSVFVTGDFLAVILGIGCFIIGMVVRFFLREKEKIANEI